MPLLQFRLVTTNQSKIGEVFRYALAGGSALLTHLVVLVVLVESFEFNKTLSSALGFVSATPVNYILQKIYVFKSSVTLLSSFSIYCVITISTLILNTILFWLILSFSSLHYGLAQVVTVILIFMLNYYLNRNVTFRKKL